MAHSHVMGLFMDNYGYLWLVRFKVEVGKSYLFSVEKEQSKKFGFMYNKSLEIISELSAVVGVGLVHGDSGVRGPRFKTDHVRNSFILLFFLKFFVKFKYQFE